MRTIFIKNNLEHTSNLLNYHEIFQHFKSLQILIKKTIIQHSSLFDKEIPKARNNYQSRSPAKSLRERTIIIAPITTMEIRIKKPDKLDLSSQVRKANSTPTKFNNKESKPVANSTNPIKVKVPLDIQQIYT